MAVGRVGRALAFVVMLLDGCCQCPVARSDEEPAESPSLLSDGRLSTGPYAPVAPPSPRDPQLARHATSWHLTHASNWALPMRLPVSGVMDAKLRAAWHRALCDPLPESCEGPLGEDGLPDGELVAAPIAHGAMAFLWTEFPGRFETFVAVLSADGSLRRATFSARPPRSCEDRFPCNGHVPNAHVRDGRLVYGDYRRYGGMVFGWEAVDEWNGAWFENVQFTDLGEAP